MLPVLFLIFSTCILVLTVGLHYWTVRKNRALVQTVTDLHRGTRGERQLVLLLLKHGISSQIIFHDLYVRKTTGDTSQIDLVVPTKAGIIVFEVKEYSGWIFGKGNQDYWTQVLAYGREKYRLYNPIKQNRGHINALRQNLTHCADVPFFSVIVFSDNCRLLDVSLIPENTYLVYMEEVCELFDAILKNNVPANYGNKHEVVRILREAVCYGGNPEVQMRHIQHIRQMLERNRMD